MELLFELGSAQQPKGHGLAYFRSLNNFSAILATYLIVPPVRLDLSKYIPPMFAGKLPDVDAANIPCFAIPPIAEPVGSYDQLREMAEMRGDDLVFAGTLDASRPDSILMASNEAAQMYARLYAERPQPGAPEAELAVQDVLYSLMGERDRLGEMAKLAGKLRYAVDGSDSNLIKETVREMHLLGRFLPEKYRIDELIEASQTPGEKGGKLAALYLDRCYRLCDEEYAETAKIEAEIKSLQSAS